MEDPSKLKSFLAKKGRSAVGHGGVKDPMDKIVMMMRQAVKLGFSLTGQAHIFNYH